MLRFLPYVMVCLFVLLSGRILSILDYVYADTKSEIVVSAHAAKAVAAQDVPASTGTAELANIVSSMKEFNPLANKVIDKNAINQNNSAKNCVAYLSKDFSPTEVDILKGLKQRREELEGREKDLLFKETSMQVAQQQIEERLRTLQLLQTELHVILKQYEVKENEKHTKLVRIYESMKPKDAAKIFEEMQLNVLLDVVERMRETRLAPILASMEPIKAKELTVALVNKRKAIHRIN